MTVHLFLALAALVASALLFMSSQARALAILALVASGLEVAMALGLIRMSVSGIPLTLVLGLALAVPGLLAWMRSSTKTAVSAAVIVAFTGVLQVAVYVSGRL